jgi:hypothetical protein
MGSSLSGTGRFVVVAGEKELAAGAASGTAGAVGGRTVDMS